MKFESKALRPMCVVPFHSFTMQHQETQFPSSPELHPPAPPTIFTSLLEASDVLGANADRVLRSMSGGIPASSQPQKKPSISGRWDAGYRGRLRHDARSPALCAQLPGRGDMLCPEAVRSSLKGIGRYKDFP